MAKRKKPNHIVSFAQGHRNTILPTFDAFTALFRAQSLVEDVEHLSKLHEAAVGVEARGRLDGLEITDYYAPAYVTCLEWHARSRRADLLNFMPELIQPGMMRDLDAISQMLSAKVTLADLIGASTKINSLKTYTEVFEEIWSALRIDVPLASLLESSQKLGGRDGCLYELFERRHALVHEIGIAQVGSYILRDNWTFEEATTHGRMIVDVISKIEKQISKFASDDFPNKLDDSGYPQDRRSVLERQIEDVENRIAAAMESTGIPHFDNARNSSAHNLKVQLDFLDAALIEIPKRHYDPTPGLVAKLYRQRLEFLSAIAAELGV